MIFADAHLHSNPVSGLGIEKIAKRFKSLGGWFLALVSLPPTHYGLQQNLDGYVKAIDITISECRKARSLGLRVSCFAGIHPADLEKLLTRHITDSEKVLELSEYVLKEIARRCREGLLDGIGEVGRPHYTTRPEAFIINELVMNKALTLAKDLNVIVQLHLEQGGILTVIDINQRIESIKLMKSKVILHHLDYRTAKEATKYGLSFTIPAKYPLLRHTFTHLKPVYMIESDYIDDPRRPGIAAYPWDVIEIQLTLLNEGIVNEEYLYKLNVDNIVMVYGVEPP